MTLQALFIAGAERQAAFWAEVWGYRRGEWRFVNNHHSVAGLRPPLTVYVCGNSPVSRVVVGYLRAVGFDTFIDAHDAGEQGDPRSALENLPIELLVEGPRASEPTKLGELGAGANMAHSWRVEHWLL